MTKTIQKLQPLGDHIAASLPDIVTGVVIALEEMSIEVRRDAIVEALTFLRDDPRCQFRQLMDLCGVDRPDRVERFDVVYHLLSLRLNHRVRVKLATDEATPVPSAVGVYDSAGWYEREAWDLFGILFSGHPDLRRLLTDYGFEGHPLRKDFPLTGYVEVRYDEAQKRVVYEPVKLSQEFRSFDFESPWEGMIDTASVLPGDEKAPIGPRSQGSLGGDPTAISAARPTDKAARRP